MGYTTGNRADASAKGGAEQNRAADNSGNGRTANRADGTAGEHTLLLVIHMVTASQRNGAKCGEDETGICSHEIIPFLVANTRRNNSHMGGDLVKP